MKYLGLNITPFTVSANKLYEFGFYSHFASEKNHLFRQVNRKNRLAVGKNCLCFQHLHYLASLYFQVFLSSLYNY